MPVRRRAGKPSRAGSQPGQERAARARRPSRYASRERTARTRARGRARSAPQALTATDKGRHNPPCVLQATIRQFPDSDRRVTSARRARLCRRTVRPHAVSGKPLALCTVANRVLTCNLSDSCSGFYTVCLHHEEQGSASSLTMNISLPGSNCAGPLL